MQNSTPPETPNSTPTKVFSRVKSRASSQRAANELVDDVVDLLSKALISTPETKGEENNTKVPTYDNLMETVRNRIVLDTAGLSAGERAAHSLISLGRSTSVLSPTTRQLYLEAVFTSFDPVQDIAIVIDTIERTADIRLKLSICCACAQFRNHAAINLLVETSWLSDTSMLDAAHNETVLGAIISGPLGLEFLARNDTPDDAAHKFLSRLKVLIELWISDQIIPLHQYSPESRAVRRRIIYQIEHWACNARMIMAWADFGVAAAWSRQDLRLRNGIKPLVYAHNIDGCVYQLLRIRACMGQLLSEISALKDWTVENTFRAAIFLWLPGDNGTILFGRQCTPEAIRSIRLGTESSKIACIFDLERELDSAVQASTRNVPRVTKTTFDAGRMNTLVSSNLCFDVDCIDDITSTLSGRVKMALNSNNVFLHTVMREVSQHKTAIVAGVARFSNN